MNRFVICSFVCLLISVVKTTAAPRYVIPQERRKCIVAEIHSDGNGGLGPGLLFSRNGTSRASGSYSVAGKTYYIHAPVGTPEGSKFVIFYDSLKPAHYNPRSFAHPIFAPAEQTMAATATVTYVSYAPQKPDYSDRIIYTYIAPVKKHEQLVKKYEISYSLDTAAKDYKTLRTGARYEVEYWVNDPARAIIHLDRPVADSAQ